MSEADKLFAGSIRKITIRYLIPLSSSGRFCRGPGATAARRR